MRPPSPELRPILAALIALVLAGTARAQDRSREHDRFGESLAFCGDVDGDGREDLAIGSSGEDGVGAIRVYSIATGVLLRKHVGSEGRVGFGGELVAVADLDGDRVPELASCSWRNAIASSNGRIEIRSGRSGESLRAFEAREREMGFGRRLAVVGDVDADGVEDLGTTCVDGAPEAEPRARWLVLSGKNGDRMWSRDGPRRDESSTGPKFAALDDLDGDGKPEVAVLAGGTALFVSCAKGAVLGSWPGEGEQASGCVAIASPGDLDGDGARDLVLGEPHRSGAAGQVRVVSARARKETTAVLFANGQDQSSRFGWTVAAAGDVDGDGTRDWLASEQHIFGGLVVVVSGAANRELRSADWMDFDRPALGDRIVGDRDVDGDGVPDFAASAFRPKTGLGIAGQGVVVISGKTGKRIRGFVLQDSLPPGEAGRAGLR